MTAGPWTVVVHHNEQPITGHIPIDAWATASILAPLITGITGRTVSVMAAAHHATHDEPPGREPDPQLSIFQEAAS